MTATAESTALAETVRRMLERVAPATSLVHQDGLDALLRRVDAALDDEIGLAGLLVPESLGGLGGELSDAAAVATELGRACAPSRFVTSTVLAAPLLADVGHAGPVGDSPGPVDDHLDVLVARAGLVLDPVGPQGRAAVEGRRGVEQDRRPFLLATRQRSRVVDVDALVDASPLAAAHEAGDLEVVASLVEDLAPRDHAALPTLEPRHLTFVHPPEGALRQAGAPACPRSSWATPMWAAATT